MSWKLSRVLNNGNKKNNRLFYSLGSVERSGVIGSLIPSGQGSLTLYQKNLSNIRKFYQKILSQSIFQSLNKRVQSI